MHIIHDYEDFDPRTYLEEYYKDFPPENLALLKFLIRAFHEVHPNCLTLEVGGGPTMITPLVAAGVVRELHFSDYVPANRDEVRRWLCGHDDAFDWRETTQRILELEGVRDEDVERREAKTRIMVTRVMHCDVTKNPPIEIDRQYDVLVTNLCIEAVAYDKQQWRTYMGQVMSLLKPGGRLIMTTVKGSNSYSVGDKVFHALPLRETDIVSALLSLGFESINVEWTHADHPVHNYDGLMFTTARKKDSQ